MQGWIMIRFELCRPGWSGGLIPEVRIGIARFAWCRGSIADRLDEYRRALRDAAAMLNNRKR